jgi:hypothetical protein
VCRQPGSHLLSSCDTSRGTLALLQSRGCGLGKAHPCWLLRTCPPWHFQIHRLQTLLASSDPPGKKYANVQAASHG